MDAVNFQRNSVYLYEKGLGGGVSKSTERLYPFLFSVFKRFGSYVF